MPEERDRSVKIIPPVNFPAHISDDNKKGYRVPPPPPPARREQGNPPPPPPKKDS